MNRNTILTTAEFARESQAIFRKANRLTKQQHIDLLLDRLKEQKETIKGLEAQLNATNAAIDRFQGTKGLRDLKQIAKGVLVEDLRAENERLRALLDAKSDLPPTMTSCMPIYHASVGADMPDHLL